MYVKHPLRNLAITFSTIVIFYLAFTISADVFHSPAHIVPCQRPLPYQIGTIDPKFDLEADQLKRIMGEVESIWERPVDKNLLELSTSQGIPVNLVYSEEQELSRSRKELEKRIRENEEMISALQRDVNRLSTNYKQKKRSLEQLYEEYNALKKEYNRKVEKWNRRGGITDEARKNIQQLRRQIRNMETELQRRGSNAEQVRTQLKAKYEEVKRWVDRQQDLKERYNSRFTESRVFNQGEYIEEGNDKRINIYQFGSRDELKTVLAHEIGHALGLGHVENPESIMSKMMKEQNIHNLEPSTQDLSALREICEN